MGNEPPSVPPSESELERFFDLGLDLLVILGFDGYFTQVNPAAEPFPEFLHPDDVQRTIDAFADVKSGNDVIGFENRYRCADGSVRWIQWNSWTVPEQGVVYAVGRDVTDRRRADAELREAKRMAEASRAELAASRTRIVAAADAERRRVVRDLHDGAQQRLVLAVITLKQARSALEDEQETVPGLIAEALEHTEGATTELRELAHGILPAVLTRGGLRAGVEALTSRMLLSVENGASVGPLPATVEATAYFVVCEALTNVANHARAGCAEVTAKIEEDTLVVQVRDDGVGGTLITASIPLAGSAPGSEARPEL